MMMKKTFALTLIAASLFAALFVGCSNMGADAGAAANSNGATAGGQNGAVTISGSLGFSGAMPAQIAALVNSALCDSGDAASRSAFPKTPSASSLAISVYAEEVTDSDTKLRYDGTIAADKQSYTVGIPVTSGKKYYVHAVAKSGGVEVFSGKSALLDFTADPNKFYANCDIALGASQTGKGGVNLTVNVEGAGVERARMGYKPKGSDTITWVSSSKNLAGTVRYFSVGVEDGVVYPDSAIESGNYTMTFEFYSGAETPENLLYSFKESVNVFDNLVTDTWVKIGGEPWLTSSSSGTACKVTAAMVEGFWLTDIYVDSNADDDSGSGTFLHPKQTFADALDLLKDANVDYTIHIKGDIRGGQTIPENLYAKSLTLCGATPIPTTGANAGIPQDKIDAMSRSASALLIQTAVPITIENLKITGGKGTTEFQDHPVDGTITYVKGGGIYLSATGGTLTLGRGACVSNNTADAGSGAKKNGQGGGIYINSSSKLTILDGAVIESNSASTNGGGVYLSASGTIEMAGGKIDGNYANAGGGVYNLGEFNMNGGLIANNQHVANKGGAVYLKSGSFNIVGNSCIPPASGNQNDFYLSDEKKITITGALSPTSDGTASGSAVTTVAQITPYRYRDYESVLFRAASPNPMTRIQLETSKFSVTPEGPTPWYIRTNGAIYSTQYWGTKAPTVEKNVGDIVYNDGSATPYTAFDESDTSAQKNEIIAVIAFKSGATAYGLGFYEAQKIWCDDNASGYNSYISDYTSSDSGAVAMATIKALSDYGESNYPAFWYADHYDGGGNLGKFNSGWFIPSLNEMKAIGGNKTTINAAIDKARNAYGGNNKFGGDSGGKSYWTASQFENSTVTSSYKLVYRYVVPLSSGTNASSGYDKNSSCYVRPIHAF